MSNIVIRIENLSKKYVIRHQNGSRSGDGLRHAIQSAVTAPWRKMRQRRPGLSGSDSPEFASEEDFYALKDVSFDVKRGEVLGIIGRNGAGKSTLLKILSRITEPTSGRIGMKGRVASLLEVGTGFHPELTGRENIYLNGAILGMGQTEVKRKFDEIVDFSGVEKFIDTPVKRYSSGMYVRLAFAVAAHLEPEILIVDEVLAVGDAQFQKKCLGRIEHVAGKEGRTVLFVSHSMPVIARMCGSVILLGKGTVVASGNASEVAHRYLADRGGNHSVADWIPESPVGDESAKLHRVRLHDAKEKTTSSFSVEEEIFCTVDFEIVNPEIPAIPALHLINDIGTIVFATAAFALTKEANRSAKTVRSATCTIPRNLVAEGNYTILVAVVSYNPDTVHALEREAVSMVVVDPTTGEGVRGTAAAQWPGVVRPKLEWIYS